MNTVGIRELNSSLSKQLDIVRNGGSVSVTERGRPIARIVPVEGMSTLEQLVAEGRVTPATKPKRRTLPPPIDGAGPVSDLIADQRR